MENAHHPQQKPVTGYPAAQPSYHPTHATAYPYPAPPPAPYYANPYPARPPPPLYNPRRATFLRRLIAAAIAIIIIIGAITFIIWLVLRPRLPEFSVSSATVSPFNVSASSLTANWEISFSVRNPNKKMNVEYGDVIAYVYYGSDLLAQTTLPPFYQVKGNLTTFRARLAAASSYINDGTAKDLLADRGHGDVEFRVKLLAWMRFRSGAWRTRRHFMKVSCGHINVGFSPPAASGGSLSGAPRPCDVYL